QYDQLIRVAASLRNRTAPAHVVLQRLVSSTPSDLVAKALRELGRMKTIYILRYIDDPVLRKRVQRQLNRGEHRQSMAKRIGVAPVKSNRLAMPLERGEIGWVKAA
ncbi:MAG: Tn3 family transposase, partial [Bacteroidota bacterium]